QRCLTSGNHPHAALQASFSSGPGIFGSIISTVNTGPVGTATSRQMQFMLRLLSNSISSQVEFRKIRIGSHLDAPARLCTQTELWQTGNCFVMLGGLNEGENDEASSRSHADRPVLRVHVV